MEISQLRELLPQQRMDELLSATRSILASQPQRRDALLFQAIALRNLGRIPDALQVLDTLQQPHTVFSRLFEERGRCVVALRQAPQAIAAFREAVRIYYALPGSWSMLE